MPAASDGATPSGPVTASQATRVALRASVVVTSLAGVAAVVVAFALRGGSGGLGALLGAVIAVAFFTAGQYAVGRLLSRHAELALTGGLLVYLTQVLVLFLLIALLKDATWLDPKAFAATIVVCTVTWVATQVWVSARTKTLVVEPVPHDDQGADHEAEAGR